MRLLIVTQTLDLDDPILGFFHAWVIEFARTVEQVHVICLYQGRVDLPPNVSVHSLGKERGGGSKLRYALRFLRLLVRLHGSYDRVFIHMNVEYLVLAGWWWKLHGIPAGLWYVHKAVTLRLRIAVAFARAVFSSSAESFRMATAKLQIVGHGIELGKYAYRPVPFTPLRLVTIGRISEAKRIKEMLDVCDQLVLRDVPFQFSIYGAAVTPADKIYLDELTQECNARSWRDHVRLHGPVAHSEVPAALAEENVFLNLSRTGSMDKAILEAMAAGVLPVTTNEAFARILPEACFVSDYSPAEVADRLARIYAAPEAYRAQLRAHVQKEAQKHSLTSLISTLVHRLEEMS